MKKLAIIGTGISGMSAAYFLQRDYDITIFEKNDYIGGHTNTIDVDDGKSIKPMDTGFMVFNEQTYPLMIKLFNKLKVPYCDTDMSFSVRNNLIDLEYNGCNLDGLFSQRKNVFNLKYLNMLRQVVKFNNHSDKMLTDPQFDQMNIEQYIKYLGLNDYFLNNYLIPMCSAVWSTPMDRMRLFPAKSLVRFFKNHGLAGIDTQLQWKTVVGGSREYRNRLIRDFADKIQLNSPVTSVKEENNSVEIVSNKASYLFDKVIVCSHADEALSMLASPSKEQKEILGCFKYQKNIATIHTDESVLPKLKKNWSSWNFVIHKNQPYTVYYMNRLQRISENKDFFISINGESLVQKDKIIKQIEYHHPTFDIKANQAQTKLDELNKKTNIHFSGSYYRYGFHEDGLLSSINLCKSILGKEVL